MAGSSPRYRLVFKGSLSEANAGFAASRLRYLGAGVLVSNVAVWIALALCARHNYPLFWKGTLAYLLGLRHGLDADHIAAIDNVTRKLRQDGQQPLGVGVFFALGHSAIVSLMALALVFAVNHPLSMARGWGEFASRLASATFLTLIGALNLRLTAQLWTSWRTRRTLDAQNFENIIKPGIVSGIFSFLYKHVDASWKMVFVGFLFGLGFDTASQAGLFGICVGAAQSVTSALSPLVLLLTLFSAGMVLTDTVDSILMTMAYDWAMGDVNRKLAFNFVITALSSAVALGVAVIEWLQLCASRLNLDSGLWRLVREISFEGLGISIVVTMVVVWVFAAVAYRISSRSLDSRVRK